MSVPLSGGTSRSGVPQVVCAECQQFWDLSSDDKWALYGTDNDTRIMARNTATGAATIPESGRRNHGAPADFRRRPLGLVQLPRGRGTIRIMVVPSCRARWSAVSGGSR